MKTTEQRQSIMIRCGRCRRVIYAAINEPGVIDKTEKRAIAKMVTQGHTVEHVPAQTVREAEWECQCKASARQPQPEER